MKIKKLLKKLKNSKMHRNIYKTEIEEIYNYSRIKYNKEFANLIQNSEIEVF